MRRWTDLSYRTKVTAVILGICTSVLLVACAALFAFQILLLDRTFRGDVESVARVAARAATGAAVFGDATSAREVLASLEAKTFVQRAALLRPEGGLVAEWERPGTKPPDPSALRAGVLVHVEPVTLDGETIGWLRVESDYRDVHRNLLAVFAALTAGVLVICLALGLFLSRRLQRLVADPVLHLADTANRIAAEKDYSLRAELGGRDEIGHFAHTFNEMLVQIEGQDAELQAARAKLESQVVALEREIAERRRLEDSMGQISQREQRRIAQDLHDGLGQLLTGLAFKARLLQALLEDKRLNEADLAARLVDLANDATRQARDLAHGLAPVVLDRHGLIAALRQLAGRTCELLGVRVEVDAPATDLELPPNVAIELYRIAQEAVHNAVRHGQSATILIVLAAHDRHWRFEVRDDGVGFHRLAVRSDGMGLKIMQHRARTLGGTFEIRAGEPRGTVVSVRLPLSATVPAAVASEPRD
jgi:signal transduction histidine kinase